jgi:hypothetical protein
VRGVISKIETRVTDWTPLVDAPWFSGLPHGGYTQVRIWQRHDGMSFQQRHEWMCANGSTEMDDWIISPLGFCPHAKPVEEACDA